MAAEDSYRISSEDYADLLVETSKLNEITQIFPDAVIHPVNFLLSLVNVPVGYITNFTVKELGYSVIPSVLGLIGYEKQDIPTYQKLQNNPGNALRGQGVLLAIIGTGIDYTNPLFQYADGTTRIAAIWDQTIQTGNPPNGFLYGTEYTREQINQALQSGNPYEYVPSIDEIGHGTLMAGIAGGKEESQNNFYGVAPDAEFIVVKLKQAKKYLKKFFCIPEDVIGYQENDVTFALNYILNTMSIYSKPIAIGITINTSEGSHDGRGTLNDYISYLAVIPGIAILIGAGNEGMAKRHFLGLADQKTGFDTVQLLVGDNEKNFYMQIYLDGPGLFSMDIVSPSGEHNTYLSKVEDEFQEIRFLYLDTIVYIDYQVVESQTGIQLIFFRFINPAPGIWSFIINKMSDINLNFHVWLPMEGFISDNTYFIRSEPTTTVLALATTTTTITVTAYNTEDDSIYPKAGKGFSRIGGITPSITAPGVNIIGPSGRSDFAAFSGTSVSAAYMTGVAAMLLEWGIVQGNSSNMSSVEIKNFVEAGARRSPNMTYPNQEWGFGILDLNQILKLLQ